MTSTLYELQKKLYYTLAALAAIFVVGTIGFKLIGGENWSILDSLYMTVITITTVGFGEIHDLTNNPAARIFTIFMLLFGMGVLAYGVGNITAFIVEGNLMHIMWRRQTMREINRMKNHIIVCGAGEIGHHVIEEFQKIAINFVIIEKNSEIVANLREKLNVSILQGDATDDDILIEAGINKAAGIISTLHSDKDNLFITVSARQLNPSIRIVVHAVDQAAHKKLVRSGANAAVSTNSIGAMRLASEMVRPTVVNFLDQMLRLKEQTIRIEEVTIKPKSDLIDQSLYGANIGKKTGVLVIAIRNMESNQFVYTFSKELRLKKNDILVALGTVDQIKKLRELAGYEDDEAISLDAAGNPSEAT
ncbi:potassium channel protein [bacterium]|nr:potassium channel protein [bacterium]